MCPKNINANMTLLIQESLISSSVNITPFQDRPSLSAFIELHGTGWHCRSLQHAHRYHESASVIAASRWLSLGDLTDFILGKRLRPISPLITLAEAANPA